MLWRILAILVISAGLGVFVAACDSDDDGTTQPTPAPIVVTVTATPNEVDTGEKVSVKATVNTNPKAPLSYQWMSEVGTFSDANADSTGWTGPDDPGMYTLSCVVTDQVNVAIGIADVAVATYMPPVSPFYRGADACGVCHDGGSGGDQYASWANSGHAGAYETLIAIGQQENHCTDCHTVGTYGLGADPDNPIDNGGFDETAVERLAGVQCENCHAAGSDHPSPTFASVQWTLDAALCGGCHNGSHHPTFDEWSSSAHSGVVGFAATRASCSKCHNGLEAPIYLDDPENYVAPGADPTESLEHTCAVCHDPHGNDNLANLRNAAVTDVVFPDGQVQPEGGAGRLCMSCHNGRRTEEDRDDMIQNGSSHFGPHHSVQGDMLSGISAHEDVAPTFPFTTSQHLKIEDGCVSCHTHGLDEDPQTGITYTGHTFLPRVEACSKCHGTITDFSDIGAKQDYDGNGMIEGVQDEVEGLAELLKQAIIDDSTSQAAMDSLNQDFEGFLGDTSVTTVRQREAGYNWTYVEFDGSHGVHNATYSIQLLQQSIIYVGGVLPKRAYILTHALN